MIKIVYSYLYQIQPVQILFFVVLLSILGCQKKPELAGFNEEAWQKDSRSCQNIRPTLLPVFEKVRHQLNGLSHTQIIAILGKPEGESLENSGGRIYYYFTQPGVQCNQSSTTDSQASKIAIRFDALDRVNEILFLNP